MSACFDHTWLLLKQSPKFKAYMYRVLSVGLDSSTLFERNLLLQSAGHSVISSSSLKEAVNRIRTNDLDLILLCHSIPATDRERMTCLIRASGSLVSVVSVAETKGQRDLFPDATFDESDQSSFLSSIHEILASSANKRFARTVRIGNGFESRRVKNSLRHRIGERYG
jgi:hypothetical protein